MLPKTFPQLFHGQICSALRKGTNERQRKVGLSSPSVVMAGDQHRPYRSLRSNWTGLFTALLFTLLCARTTAFGVSLNRGFACPDYDNESRPLEFCTNTNASSTASSSSNAPSTVKNTVSVFRLFGQLVRSGSKTLTNFDNCYSFLHNRFTTPEDLQPIRPNLSEGGGRFFQATIHLDRILDRINATLVGLCKNEQDRDSNSHGCGHPLFAWVDTMAKLTRNLLSKLNNQNQTRRFNCICSSFRAKLAGLGS